MLDEDELPPRVLVTARVLDHEKTLAIRGDVVSPPGGAVVSRVDAPAQEHLCVARREVGLRSNRGRDELSGARQMEQLPAVRGPQRARAI